MTGSTLGHSIVNAVMRNLLNRKGVGDELAVIDIEVYKEMVEDLVRDVDRLLPPDPNARLVLRDAL